MTTFANGTIITDIFQSNFRQPVLCLTKVCTVQSDRVLTWQMILISDE